MGGFDYPFGWGPCCGGDRPRAEGSHDGGEPVRGIADYLVEMDDQSGEKGQVEGGIDIIFCADGDHPRGWEAELEKPGVDPILELEAGHGQVFEW